MHHIVRAIVWMLRAVEWMLRAVEWMLRAVEWMLWAATSNRHHARASATGCSNGANTKHVRPMVPSASTSVFDHHRGSSRSPPAPAP
eukprot:192344-Prorocentrum_minimum.AAC.1